MTPPRPPHPTRHEGGWLRPDRNGEYPIMREVHLTAHTIASRVEINRAAAEAMAALRTICGERA